VSRSADDHGQIPALTGVRALAAWLVFFHHHPTKLLEAGPLLLWWELHIGVTLFFVLSGFVITWRYDRRGVETRRESFLRGYLVNRFARIYPLYFVLVVLAMASYRIRSPRAWLLNLPVFTSIGAGIPQAWSLRVEECFYLAAPVIFLLWRKNPALPLAAGGALLLALYPLAELPALDGILGPPRDLFLYTFFGRFFEFYAGVWLAKRVARSGAAPPARGGRGLPAWTLGGLAGIAGVVVALAALKTASGEAYTYGLYHPAGIALNNLVLPVCIAAFYWGLIRERSWLRSLLSTRAADLLGRSSYAFYLIHFPPVLTILAVGVLRLVHLASASADLALGRLLQGHVLAMFLFVNLAAIALYEAIERPANRFLRARFGGRVVAPATKPGVRAAS
jgi:peptidoglycan/LPS O-acetylase OafA/YrhL